MPQVTQVIQGNFSDDTLGRVLLGLAQMLDNELEKRNLLKARSICIAAEQLTDDPQWKAVRRTIEETYNRMVSQM